ncbi:MULTISPECIES: NAD-dependent epimerase/dehydratase family protein [unclassified Microbacterium]|uniref:NAD-dependent epimerase/dehydratase family protein n=1 Tax=unclassified Microbacterium TaxID=2609290 RepID=UPI00214BA5E6|nr:MULTISPECIES: NAD-dependent epimerase/dehydratase family protein [unclassified Microbacterium]MCR2811202.1 NAD-dependent epimerase/dehydratase family protein [Microbacterium sp. zg.B185]WIM19801.1 NAD-dependent epimerase/dehydratase family protein [Microbacterium sp. zg-B185]
MIVLVTGASGFLGRAVVADLVAAGHRVRTLQRRPSGVEGATDVLGSITAPTTVAHAIDGAEGVVHLAAKVSLTGPADQFREVNVEGTRLLLDAAEAAGVSRFVQVSSPSVAYAGSALAGVGAEPADPARARGHYARTKAHAELIALGRDSAAMNVVAVRPHLVWGPGDTQLIARIVSRARRGTLPLLNGGTALIDTTYIDNAASGISAALHRAPTAHGRAYVLTNGEPRPVGELLAGICLAAGVRPPRWSLPAGLGRAAGSVIEGLWAVSGRTDEPPMTRFLAEQLSTAHWFDQRQTRRALAWSPQVTIDEGLGRLAADYAS